MHFLPKGKAHPSEAGCPHQNPPAEQITSSYHLPLPGDRPDVWGEQGQGPLGRSLPWVNLHLPSVLRAEAHAQKAIYLVEGAGGSLNAGNTTWALAGGEKSLEVGS